MQAIGQYNLQPTRSNIGQVSSGSMQLATRQSDVRQSEVPGRASQGGPPPNVGGPLPSSQLSGPYPSYPPGSRASQGYSYGPATTGGPAVGSTPSVGGMSGIAGSSISGSQAGYGPQVPYSTSQQYPHQPLIGRMPSSASTGAVGRVGSAAQQVAQQSPFVPAATIQPSIPGRSQARFTGRVYIP